MADDDVLIVAAGYAHDHQYREFSAYACRLGRSFRTQIMRMGLYARGAIQLHLARIRYREDGVWFTEAEAARRRAGSVADQHVARVITASLLHGTWREGTRGQVFLLSGPDDADTIRLPRPVLNDATSAKTGGPPGAVKPACPARIAGLGTDPDRHQHGRQADHGRERPRPHCDQAERQDRLRRR